MLSILLRSAGCKRVAVDGYRCCIWIRPGEATHNGRTCTSRLGFGSAPLDPFRILGLRHDASEDEVKRAYKVRALKWHPDRHPADTRDEAQRRFSEIASAYEILKDSEKRQQNDITGGLRGSAQRMAGAAQPTQKVYRAEGRDRIMKQFLQHKHQMELRRHRQLDATLRPDVEVRIRHSVSRIHRASRASGITEELDETRASFAGKIGRLIKCDPNDQSVIVRIADSDGHDVEIPYGAGAVWEQRGLYCGMEVLISPNASVIDKASQEAGISADDDWERGICANTMGCITEIDLAVMKVKIRVSFKDGHIEELWFGMGAFEPILSQQVGT